MEHRQQELVMAYVLQTRPYRENSMLVELLTQSHGRVSAIARIARRGRGQNNPLQPFVLLAVTWSGRSNLVTLNNIENYNRPLLHTAAKLLHGLYVNELLLKTLEHFNPLPALFLRYGECLAALEREATSPHTLRLFEKDLLTLLGYGLELTHAVDINAPIVADQHYYYELERGPVLTTVSQQAIKISGKTLLALASELFDDEVNYHEIKQLMRLALSSVLQYRPLKSRQIYGELLQLL